MDTLLHEELTDSIYRTVLEPEAWQDVIRLMRASFPSSAQAFYFLDRRSRKIRPISLHGVEQRWLASFNAFYFAADNPWMLMTQRLHRPGLVRTNERLDQILGDHGALYRSSYFNEWMRPQGFKYTLGNTLSADDDQVGNITLMRSPDLPTFSAAEVATFETLSRQLTRALQISMQVEWAQSDVGSARAFDRLPDAVALIDEQRCVRYANAAMEGILREKRGLALFGGSLHALQADAQQRLKAWIADAFGSTRAAPQFFLKYGHSRDLALRAVPATGLAGRYLPAVPMLLLKISDPSEAQCPSCDELRERYGFTKSEARLVQSLVQEGSLPSAAKVLGITHGTARGYLKAAFQKAGVNSQPQLVGRVLHAC